MNKFLDGNGLRYLWGKIRAEVVPVTRKVCNKALSTDITLSASDVGALTQTQADERYLKLSGGTVSGSLTVNGVLAGESGNNVAKNASGMLHLTTVNESGTSYALAQLYPQIQEVVGIEVEHDNHWILRNKVLIRGVESPQQNDDAANKKYVDNAIAAAITGAINASY